MKLFRFLPATLFLGLSGNAVFTQIHTWSKALPGNGDQEAADVHYGKDKKLYVSGSFESTVDFDPGPGVANYTSTSDGDGFVAKYDTTGNLVHVIPIGGIAFQGVASATSDKNGNVYAVGNYHFDIDLDPGPGVYTLPTTGVTDIFVAKYDLGGNFVWGFPIHGNGWTIPYHVMIDQDENILVCGSFEDTVDFDPGPGIEQRVAVGQWDGFIAHYSRTGGLIWVNTYGDSMQDEVIDMTIGPDGNIHCTGEFMGTVDFNNGPGTDIHTSAGVLDIFYVTCDTAGNFIRSFVTGGTGSDFGLQVRAGNDGSIYLTGAFEDVCDFEPGAGTTAFTAIGAFPDIYYARFDSVGNLMWVHAMGSIGIDHATGMAVDNAGDLFLTGHFPYTMDLDPGVDSLNFTSLGFTDVWFAKYSGADGSLVWAAQAGNSGRDYSNDIDIDNNGGVYVAGGFELTVDFDPSGADAFLTSTDNEDGYFAKYSDELLTAAFTPLADQQLSVSPNPIQANGNLFVQTREDMETITLLTLAGQELKKVKTHEGGAFLNLAGVSPGMYIVKAESDELSWFAKVIIQ